MTEEQKIEALQRILQGANVAQVNLGDGYQTFNLGKAGGNYSANIAVYQQNGHT